MNYFVLTTILVSSIGNALAAGDGHGGGSPLSLAFPFFNFIIFVGILVWKLKGPINSFFENRSRQISESFHRAQLKAQEAKIKQNHLEEKLKNLDKEVAKIAKENADMMKVWESKVVSENRSKIEKLSIDGKLRLEAEKQGFYAEFKRKILTELTEKTKKGLTSSKDTSSLASKKILEGLK